MLRFPRSGTWFVVIFLAAICTEMKTDSLVGSTSADGLTSAGDLALWIDEKQVKEYSGFPMKIHVIVDGSVLPYVLDPNFEKYLPVIPAEVTSVNFTWKGGDRKSYNYHFDQLISYDHKILSDPVVTIEPRGRVPRKPRIFSVELPCSGNASGVASFAFGLHIFNEVGVSLPGTPLRLKLEKQCQHQHADQECDRKCSNGGRCSTNGRCECPKGYIGQFCQSALCYPVCMNGGTCVSPGICTCPDGYQGPHCEGGICREKCLNGGKCVQKDTCWCRKGYYGPRCEYNKCLIPCLHEGRCIGVNRCRCKKSFKGSQCEIIVSKSSLSAQTEVGSKVIDMLQGSGSGSGSVSSKAPKKNQSKNSKKKRQKFV